MRRFCHSDGLVYAHVEIGSTIGTSCALSVGHVRAMFSPCDLRIMIVSGSSVMFFIMRTAVCVQHALSRILGKMP